METKSDIEHLSQEWWKKTESIAQWGRDRIILLNRKIDGLMLERDSLQKVVNLVENLKKIKEA